MHLLTMHNLFFIARLMDLLRDAVANDSLASVAAELRAGKSPWEVAAA